ncbi:MAG: gliding motility protein GldN [Flavobacteriales bacterium]|nr:gliding motility protein GldN [Flavobacteriales bacterium]
MRTATTLVLLIELNASEVGGQVIAPPPSSNTGSGQENSYGQRVVPYPYVREADVMWQKRVWRDIDVTEKVNHPLFYPLEPVDGRSSLFDIIKNALLLDGSITAFYAGVDGWDDEFTQMLSVEQVHDILIRTDTIQVESLEGDVENMVQRVEATSDDIRRYRIKEDWIFDKQRSCMDVRIIGLAPLKANRGDDGEIRGYQPLFWLYFPEIRYVLVNHSSFNRWNDGEQRSFDHLFRARMFSSTVVKESNVFDRNISEYKTGVDGVLESERIKTELFEFEHDLWHY